MTSKIAKILSKNKIKAISFFVVFVFLFLSFFLHTSNTNITFTVNKASSFEKKQQCTKTFDASVLNEYYSGQFTLAWDKKSDCELVSTKDFKINPLAINGKQYQIKLFNLGNGQFREKNDFYTIKSIGKNAFKDNKNIGEVLAIPTSIKTINDYAFANTTIKNIYIKNVTDFLPINENAFDGCEIKKIFVHNEIYKNDTNWKKICKNNDKNIVFKSYTLNDYKNFMAKRTFCIGVIKTGSSCGIPGYIGNGTAWIVDKVNRNNDSDYKYLIATNLHVCSSISDYGGDKNVGLVFCNSEDIINQKNNEGKSKKMKDYLDVIWPIKINIDLVKKANQNFTSDFCIIEIDFNIDQAPEPYKKILKNKLDALNRCLLLDNSFIVYATDVAKEKTKAYSFGYPTSKNWGKSEAKGTLQDCEIYFNKKDFIGGCSYYKWIYGIRNASRSDFGDGSSGSMVIDANFNVIGIHHSGAMKPSYDGGYTNLASCLHVNDEYNQIATFLHD